MNEESTPRPFTRRWITPEAVVAIAVFVITSIFAIGAYRVQGAKFETHMEDFELRTKEEFVDLKARIHILEERERELLTALTTMKAQLSQIHRVVIHRGNIGATLEDNE